MPAAESYAPRVAPRSTRHRVRGLTCHASEWGQAGAPLLIYLHGWGDNGATFQFVVDALERDWHVVAPDWRGFGRSAHSGTGYWFPDYLADLHELLRIYTPGAPATLVGHSMGGNVAALYAGAMPQRVASLINVEGFGLAKRDADEAPAHYRRWLEALARAPAYSDYTSFDELVPRIRQRAPRLSAAGAHFVARQWARRGRDNVVRVRADPLHKLPNAVMYRRAEARACWRRIEANVLAIVGESSGLEVAARHWLDEVQSGDAPAPARRRTIAAAGHMVHFDAPRALAAAIEEFLAS